VSTQFHVPYVEKEATDHAVALNCVQMRTLVQMASGKVNVWPMMGKRIVVV
jgi:hypothetical protein